MLAFIAHYFALQIGEGVHGMKTTYEIAQFHCRHPVMVSQRKKEILDQSRTFFETKRALHPKNNGSNNMNTGTALNSCRCRTSKAFNYLDRGTYFRLA